MGGKLNVMSAYRSVGTNGDRDFAPWVRSLGGWDGVYIIRARKWNGSPGEYLYIGESHEGKLYATMTRHFQHWEGPQSKTTYDREDVLVAVKLTRNGVAAIEAQDALICDRQPKDNLDRPCGSEPDPEPLADEVPF